MIREIIKVDEDKCNGCGLCVTSCAEGALQIIDGKAKLVSEIYCDGLGACLGECPEGALTIEVRNSDEFDEKAVESHLETLKSKEAPKAPKAPAHFGGCPGTALRSFGNAPATDSGECMESEAQSQLGQWPVQLHLVPPGAPFLKNANILVCADCVPFAVPDFHERYLKGRAVLVGCPKLDDLSFYREKLKAIFSEATPKSITVLRMEVPCCGGIASAVVEARDASLPDLPVNLHIIGVQGDIRRDEV